MVERNQAQYGYGSSSQTASAEYDQGLRAYMLKVYNYMASGVLLTGIIAMMVGQSPNLAGMLFNLVPTANGFGIAGYTGLGMIAAFSPLAFILVLSFGANKMSAGALQGIFWAFAAMMGLSISSIMFVYTGASIAQTFFITAASFGALSLFGYTTKKNLSGMGTFLFMGLIGLIIASVVNLFMQSSMMDFIISTAGVLIFAGLTAYDTQKIKQQYAYNSSHEGAAKSAILGAVTLYLDFVNLFMFLLRFLGNRE